MSALDGLGGFMGGIVGGLDFGIRPKAFPLLLQLEVQQHLPSRLYEVFVQRCQGRDAFMVRISRGREEVALAYVPTLSLYHGTWRVPLLENLAEDIERRGKK